MFPTHEWVANSSTATLFQQAAADIIVDFVYTTEVDDEDTYPRTKSATPLQEVIDLAEVIKADINMRNQQLDALQRRADGLRQAADSGQKATALDLYSVCTGNENLHAVADAGWGDWLGKLHSALMESGSTGGQNATVFNEAFFAAWTVSDIQENRDHN